MNESLYLSGLYGVQGLTGLATGFAQASALRAQGEYQARMLQLNAELARFQAQDAIKRGNKSAEEYQKKVSQLLGSQRVALAGQGIAVGEGSAAQIQAETAAQGAEDVVTIRSNAWREAWGYRVQAADLEGQAAMAKIGSQYLARQSILTGIANSGESFLRAGAHLDRYFDDRRDLNLQKGRNAARSYFEGSPEGSLEGARRRIGLGPSKTTARNSFGYQPVWV